MTNKRIGILAGEASGDNLGAGLMGALTDLCPQPVEFIGVGGPRMLQAGLQPLADMNLLSVNGFREPLAKLPGLYRLLRQLEHDLVQQEVDAFIGVDFNVFNFLLEKRLKKRGIKTVHYVSPSVYAWRTGRTVKIAKSTDLLLCLYPFEPAFYANTSVTAEFVGHPLADEISPQDGDDQARQQVRTDLGLATDRAVLALLPGSRSSEVKLMIEPFLQAAALLHQQDPGLQLVVPCLRTDLRAMIEAQVQQFGLAERMTVCCYTGNARKALIACDVALVKSGTSTLEAMLLHRPMVVSYRLGELTYHFAKRVLRTPYVALPNILSGRELVPELLQHEGTPENLAAEILHQLAAARQAEPSEMESDFRLLHEQLRQDANRQAASAVLGLLNANQ